MLPKLRFALLGKVSPHIAYWAIKGVFNQVKLFETRKALINLIVKLRNLKSTPVFGNKTQYCRFHANAWLKVVIRS